MTETFVAMIDTIRRSRFGLGLITICLACFSVASAQVEEKPDWEFDIAETELALFEAPQFFSKDYGWLLTFRMRVKSLSLVKPISEITFRGYDEEEAVVWEEEHTIRRKDFEAAYGGGRSQFVRVLLKDVPSEVVLLKLHYGDEDEETEEE